MIRGQQHWPEGKQTKIKKLIYIILKFSSHLNIYTQCFFSLLWEWCRYQTDWEKMYYFDLNWEFFYAFIQLQIRLVIMKKDS
jgi:hypothetical protein